MGIVDRIRLALLPAPIIQQHIRILAAQEDAENFQPDHGWTGQSVQPGVWGEGGEVMPPVERLVRSIIVNSAITRFGNELASAEVNAGRSSGPMRLEYPAFQWRGLLKAMARRHYLDGGWYLWGSYVPRRGPIARVAPEFWLFAPTDLQDIGGKIGISPPTSYRYARGNFDILADEISWYLSAAVPRQVDRRLAGIIRLERNAVEGQQAASENAGRPRIHMSFDYNARRPAIDNALRSKAATTEATAQDAPAKSVQRAIEAATGGNVLVTYAGEDAKILNYSADTQFGETINSITQMVSADSGIPAPFLASTENLTFANIVQLTRVMYESVIIPLAQEFAAAIRAQGIFPEFQLDFSNHYAVQQTATERAALIDKVATALERLNRAGYSQDQALKVVAQVGLSGLLDIEINADE